MEGESQSHRPGAVDNGSTMHKEIVIQNSLHKIGTYFLGAGVGLCFGDSVLGGAAIEEVG